MYQRNFYSDVDSSDLRKGSETFLHWSWGGAKLRKSKNAVCSLKGFAHGFQSLEDQN